MVTKCSDDPQRNVSSASNVSLSSENVPSSSPPRNAHTPPAASTSCAAKRLSVSDPLNGTSSVGQFCMSSSSVIDAPSCVIRQSLVPMSPVFVPHPQPPPFEVRTTASAIQLAPFIDRGGAGTTDV